MLDVLLAKSVLSDVVLWVIMGAMLVLFIWSIFHQREQGKTLKYELDQLDKLKENNVESEFVLRAMKLATWHMDAKTRTMTYDSDFREKNTWLASYTEGEDLIAAGKPLHPDDYDRVMKALDDLCEGRSETYHQEYRVVMSNADKFYWEESYATIVDRDVEGKPNRIVGTSMIINDRKAMEDALIEARNQAEESNRMKSAFIANISHEIRTPLNAIVGFTGLLPDMHSDEERQQLVGLINENTQKLLSMINDIVTISKVESGQEQISVSRFDLNQLLAEQVERFSQMVQPGVELLTGFAGEEQPMVTDYHRVSEIIKQLLSNAVKFTQKGSVTVGYDAPQNGGINIWVKDTGKGISEENQQRVFERFYKVDEFVPGTGLGLSLCRIMAKSIGGNITVESAVGEGSLFTLHLPVH